MSDRNEEDQLPRLLELAANGRLDDERRMELSLEHGRVRAALKAELGDAPDAGCVVEALSAGRLDPRELTDRGETSRLGERIAQIVHIRLLHDTRAGALDGPRPSEPFRLSTVLAENHRGMLAEIGEVALRRLADAITGTVYDAGEPTVNELRALVAAGVGATLVPCGPEPISAGRLVLDNWSRITRPDGRRLIIAWNPASDGDDAFFLD